MTQETLPVEENNQELSPKAETPEAIAEVETAEEVVDSEDSAIVEPEPLNALQLEEALQAAMQAAVSEIMSDDSHFENLEKHETQELVFLMENIAGMEEVKANISRVAQLKKAFDTVYQTAAQASSVLEPGEAKEKHDKKLHAELSRFQTAFGKFNKKKDEFEKQADQEKEHNSKLKDELLTELRSLVELSDPTIIDKVRNIQDRWKAIGLVKHEDMTRLFQTFRQLLDSFYDLRGKYNDLRQIDRVHKMEEKGKLIEEAKRLVPSEEINDREFWKDKTEEMKMLQELWKATGGPPDEAAEELWNQFRQVADEFYAARNKYYEQQDLLKSDNTAKKQELMNQIAPFATFTATKPSDWKDATDKILELQKTWNDIGPATQDSNTLLWGQYRTSINSFFERKSNFFKTLDQDRKENLSLKTALCEEAEKLKDSNEWKKATDKIKHLQEKWKSIGPVPDRDSQRIWKRFRSACDAYFQRKEHHFAALSHDFEENMAKKIALCEQAESMSQAENKPELIQAIKDLQSEWTAIGLVPMKEKEKLWNRFRAACDKFFQDLGQIKSEYQHIKTRMHYENIASKTGDTSKNDPLKFEERKLRDKVRELEGQIDQYETNVLFISKGKAGDALRLDIQKKVEQVKKDKAQILEKLKVLKEVKSGS
jgi:hypothetical protein